MHRIDGAGHDNYSWVAEDTATNRPPTEITADFMNAVQEEVANVVELVEPLDKADNTQLKRAIAAMIAAAATVVADATDTVKGILKLATNGLTQEGVDDTTAVTPASLSSRTATEARTGLAKVATQAVTDAGTNDSDFITPNKLKNTTLLGLGYGQTWQDVKASRSFNTTYTNTTGKPIFIALVISGGTSPNVSFNLNGSGNVQFIHATGDIDNAYLVVPNGQTYQVNSISGANSIWEWRELR